jgi:hypothetical protein
MSEEEYEDFVSEMCWSVVEQGHLFGLANGVTEPDREHGPWEPWDCSRMLVDWLEAGWLSLTAIEEASNGRLAQRRLAHAEARAVLAQPLGWTEPDGTTPAYELEATDQGYDVFTAAPHWAVALRPAA